MKANLVIGVIAVAAIVALLGCVILLYQRSKVATRFEYRVCLVQGSRVTFVNGSWQGQIPMQSADPETSMDTCPNKWDYLTTASYDGWELLHVVPLAHLHEQQGQELYLRRAQW